MRRIKNQTFRYTDHQHLSDEGLYHSNMNTTREAFDIPRLSSVITQTLTLEHTIKNYHLSGYTLKVFCFFSKEMNSLQW